MTMPIQGILSKQNYPRHPESPSTRQRFLQLPSRGEGPCVLSLRQRSTRSLCPAHALKTARVRSTDVGMTSSITFRENSLNRHGYDHHPRGPLFALTAKRLALAQHDKTRRHIPAIFGNFGDSGNLSRKLRLAPPAGACNLSAKTYVGQNIRVWGAHTA